MIVNIFLLYRQSCMEPRYSIMNSEHIEILNINGPVCVCSDPRGWDREFKVIKFQILKVC